VNSREARSLVEQHFDAERALDHLTALTRVPSPQTELFEADPQVQAFIRDRVRPSVERMGFGEGMIDGMGNYTLKAGMQDVGGVLLIGYAPAGLHARSLLGEDRRWCSLRDRGAMRVGPRRMRAEGMPGSYAGGAGDRPGL